jgi:hypothetical protein
MNTKSHIVVKSHLLEAHAPECDFVLNVMTGDFTISALEQGNKAENGITVLLRRNRRPEQCPHLVKMWKQSYAMQRKYILCIVADMQATENSVNATPYVLNYQPFGTLEDHVRSHQ